MVESAPASRMDYAQILSGLFVGSHPRAIGDVERLRRESAITAVLNLQANEDMRSVNLNWQPLETHYLASGINLLRLPMKEEQIELREKLPECVRTLSALIAGAAQCISTALRVLVARLQLPSATFIRLWAGNLMPQSHT